MTLQQARLATRTWLFVLCACDANDAPTRSVCEQGAAGPFATCVIAYEPGLQATFGADHLPEIVLGPPMGEGLNAGSFDVVSLGCDGSITLGFDPPIEDGDGPDLIVFENPFISGTQTFIEPGEVSVSADGEQWLAFACLQTPQNITGCAGLTPVTADNEMTAIRIDQAGGDAFDLADVSIDTASYVRIVDRSRAYYGDDTWCTGPSGGFDLDAIAVLHP